MKTTYIELLKRTSKTNITLLKDVNKNFNVNKNGKFQYYYIPFSEIKGIADFLFHLKGDSLYTVIPKISMFGKDEDPYIVLSKQILMSKYSDPKTISDFLISQSEIAINDFELTSLNKFHYLIFKYKKIVLEI
jgi:hypothetical protein